MSVEERIQAYLAAADIPATIGDLPSTSANSINIILYDGNYNTEYFGGREGSTVYQPIIKIVVRNNSYEVASNYVESIKETLHRVSEDALMSILLVGSPLYLGRSEEKLHEFQITFNIMLRS